MARVKANRKLGYSVKGRFFRLLPGQIADVPDDVVKRNPHWFEPVEEPEVDPEVDPEETSDEGAEEPEVVDAQQEPAANTQVKRVRRRKK